MEQIQLKSTKEDILELATLLSSAHRPRVQAFIKQKIVLLQKEQAQLQVDIQKIAARKEAADKVAANNSNQIHYVPLTKYSYDQEGDKVKIYFLLDGVGTQCTADKVNVEFGPQSVEMKLHGYNGQNMIFAIRKLAGPILADQCKYLLKTNSLCITLFKKDKKTWTQLYYKEDMFKPEKEENADPNASLMNMMKKMYEEGDDNMKKTIAEAWTKANDKKNTKDPSMGFGANDNL